MTNTSLQMVYWQTYILLLSISEDIYEKLNLSHYCSVKIAFISDRYIPRVFVIGYLFE